LQLEDKEVKKSSADTSRASSKIRKKYSACPETVKDLNEGQKTPDPKNTVGSAAAWTPHGELVLRGGNLDWRGVISQGFLCSGSLSGGTQLELFYTTLPLNKFVWCTSCQRLCFRKPQVKPGG